MNTQKTAIVASTRDDSHTWNLSGVELMLRDRGFQVENLGSCTPVRQLVQSIRAKRPDIVAISSINGHGARTGLSMAAILRRYQAFGSSKIVIGGKLTLSPATAGTAVRSLLRAGFAGVFTGEEAWARFDAFLRREHLLADAVMPENGSEAPLVLPQRSIKDIPDWVLNGG